MSQGDCFLKIVSSKAGAIKGESDDPDFPAHISVRSWTWGLQSGQDFGRVGKAQARALEFSCNVDSSYPALLSVLVTNDVLKTVTLEMRRAGGTKEGAKAQNYLSVNLKKARLTKLDISHSAEDLVPMVRGSLAFEEVSIDYRSQGAHGGNSGGASNFQWQAAEQAS